MPVTDVTIRYLEMTAPGDLIPKRLSDRAVAVRRVPRPMPELNRFFYAAVGGDYFWLERRPWTLAQWADWAGHAELETWVLSVDGIPAGYSELERQPGGEVEIRYFGLLPAFTGRGLGAHLLTESVERAWAMGASRVILNTCNLDHPQALRNYLARGFREYRTEVQRKEVPLRAPGPWEGAVSP
jgi:GNAT superfamily N-acetyltransferase